MLRILYTVNGGFDLDSEEALDKEVRPKPPDSYCLPYMDRRMNQYDVRGLPSNFDRDKKQVVLIKTGPSEQNEKQLEIIPLETVTYRTEFPVHYKRKSVKTFYIYLLKDMPLPPSEAQVFEKY